MGMQPYAREHHDREASVQWTSRTGSQAKAITPTISCCIHRMKQPRTEEVTIAEQLKAHGYQTFFAGKWHLGSEGHWPEDQGFDINIGGHHRGSPPGEYYAPWTNPALKANKPGEYLTERLTEESIKFLEQRDAANRFSCTCPTTTSTRPFSRTKNALSITTPRPKNVQGRDAHTIRA